MVAVFVAFPLYHHWEDALLYLFAPSAGLQDPAYGRDVSYYLFSLPIYQLLLRELLVAVGFMFLGSALLYWREDRPLAGQGLHLPWGAKVHLSVLAGLGFVMGAWFFMLQRYDLLYDRSHIPLFFGPGYAQMRVVLPLIWLAIVFLLAVAVSLIFFVHTRRGLKVCLISTALFFLALGALYSPALPNLVQKYLVAPNQIVRERPFITHNIQATLAAYDLAGVETRNYPISDLPWDVRSPKLQATLRNIPVWDAEVLEKIFQQLQALRTYYAFKSVDVDRYTVGRVHQQVFLSARELDLHKLPASAQNWVNERLKYTHGNGVVMIPAAQQGEAPMTGLGLVVAMHSVIEIVENAGDLARVAADQALAQPIERTLHRFVRRAIVIHRRGVTVADRTVLGLDADHPAFRCRIGGKRKFPVLVFFREDRFLDAYINDLHLFRSRSCLCLRDRRAAGP